MKIFCDTSILVEIDRHHEEIVSLLQKEIAVGNELLISTVTVAEIMTGSYLRKDVAAAALKAKEVLNQFLWKDIDGETAEVCGKLYAYLLLTKNESVEYPDVLIAASFLSSKSDLLLTLNKKDFVVFPQIQSSVLTPQERASRLS